MTVPDAQLLTKFKDSPQYVSIRDYQGNPKKSTLSFKEQEKLFVPNPQPSAKGWVTAVNFAGVQGFVPFSYLQGPLEDHVQLPVLPQPPAQTSSVPSFPGIQQQSVPTAAPGEAHEIWMEFESRAAASNQVRAPASIVVLLDHSGSMTGDKLDACKHTLTSVVDSLIAEDEFCLIIFDDTASTVFPLQKMGAKEKYQVKDAIRAVTADGGTLFEAGLREVVASIQAKPPTCTTQRLLLLTDGQNGGTVDISDLKAILQTGVPPTVGNLKVIALAYGNDADAQFLSQIGDEYVNSSDSSAIKSVMEKVFESIKNVVYKDMQCCARSKDGTFLVAANSFVSFSAMNNFEGTSECVATILEMENHCLAKFAFYIQPKEGVSHVEVELVLSFYDINKGARVTLKEQTIPIDSAQAAQPRSGPVDVAKATAKLYSMVPGIIDRAKGYAAIDNFKEACENIVCAQKPVEFFLNTESQNSTNSVEYLLLTSILDAYTRAKEAMADSPAWNQKSGEHKVNELISQFSKPAPLAKQKVMVRM
jgi:uncharacterized protein YegL